MALPEERFGEPTRAMKPEDLKLFELVQARYQTSPKDCCASLSTSSGSKNKILVSKLGQVLSRLLRAYIRVQR